MQLVKYTANQNFWFKPAAQYLVKFKAALYKEAAPIRSGVVKESLSLAIRGSMYEMYWISKRV